MTTPLCNGFSLSNPRRLSPRYKRLVALTWKGYFNTEDNKTSIQVDFIVAQYVLCEFRRPLCSEWSFFICFCCALFVVYQQRAIKGFT